MYLYLGDKYILLTWKLVVSYILLEIMVPRDKVDGYNFPIHFSEQQAKWYLFSPLSFFFMETEIAIHRQESIKHMEWKAK